MVLLWLIIILPALIGIVGIALDTGYVYYVAQEMQNAADAGALGGVVGLADSASAARTDAARAAAENTVAGEPVTLSLNEENASDGPIVLGRYNPETDQFTPTTAQPNAVKVVVADDVGLIFGKIFEVNTADVSRESIAMIRASAGDAGLITLDPERRSSLQLNGDVTLEIRGGNIHVNSDDTEAAVSGVGNMTVRSHQLNIVGGCDFRGNVTVDSEINTGMNPHPDPLADLPAPSYDPVNDLGAVNKASGSTTIQPGYYSGGIDIGDTAEINMEPGVYVLGGAGLHTSGSSAIVGNGVMIYLLDGASLDLRGDNTVNLTPPDPEVNTFAGADTYEGVTLFQARGNASIANITGNAGMNMDGTFYMPSAPLELTGNGSTVGAQLVANRVDLDGNGDFVINFSNGNPAPSSHDYFLVR